MVCVCVCVYVWMCTDNKTQVLKAITQDYHGVLLSPSGVIDDVWRSLLLFPREFPSLCSALGCRVFDHTPVVEKDEGRLHRFEVTKAMYRVVFQLEVSGVAWWDNHELGLSERPALGPPPEPESEPVSLPRGSKVEFCTMPLFTEEDIKVVVVVREPSVVLPAFGLRAVYKRVVWWCHFVYRASEKTKKPSTFGSRPHLKISRTNSFTQKGLLRGQTCLFVGFCSTATCRFKSTASSTGLGCTLSGHLPTN